MDKDLDRLQAGLLELERVREASVLPLLRDAVLEVRAERPHKGAELALDALQLNERSGLAWHVLGVCRERCDDFTSALKCYQVAAELTPDEPELGHDVGRLAYRMGFVEQAEQLFRNYLAVRPDSIDGANNLANALRDQFRFDEAVAVVRAAIHRNPQSALLWNTVGTILSEIGDMETGIVFFDEALRLDPAFPKALYNKANALLALNQPRLALETCDAAIALGTLDSEVSMMRLARSTILLCAGEIGAGWDAYEARLEPHYADVTLFAADAPPYRPGAPLSGRVLCLIGEQGLGDEILFANVIPDIVQALGPQGRLILAAEPRLIPLFARSFPTAELIPHVTLRIDHHTVRTILREGGWEGIDLWAPLAAPLRSFRRTLADFPDRASFLVPDPDKVERWRGTLAALGPGRNVGLVWKSGVRDTKRARHYAPFETYASIFAVPGCRFVNLQYGETAAELAYAASAFGVELWTPPGIDLKNDLDDLAALMRALDLVIGPANAATNLSAAIGLETWLISVPGAWPRLGTDRYPWYPAVRAFIPPTFNAWEALMAEVGAALADRVAPGVSPAT
jgi:tetratricopeptide (TPR) repeat protein